MADQRARGAEDVRQGHAAGSALLDRLFLRGGLTDAGFRDIDIRERANWRRAERRMWEEAAALDPGDDPALQSFHAEGVRSLATFDLLRRVIAVAVR